MSSQPCKTTSSKGFTCDCRYASSTNTNCHKTSCWKVPKCTLCKERIDSWYLCSCVELDDTYDDNWYDKYRATIECGDIWDF